MALSAPRAWAQTVEPTVSRCYRLTVGTWSPRQGFRIDSVVVRLDTVKLGPLFSLTSQSYQLRPSGDELGIPRAHPSRWWRQGDTLQMLWWNGFADLRARLGGTGDTLRGRVNYGTDAVDVRYPEGSVASALAVARTCTS
jgi:hypothetical protein